MARTEPTRSRSRARHPWRWLKDGKIRPREVHPEEAGLPVHPFRDILGGTPAENAAALRALLEGADGAYRDAVLLNAAAALVVRKRPMT